MFSIQLKGFQYISSDSNLDFTINGYAYHSNSVLNVGYVCNGSNSNKYKVRWARKTVGEDIYLVLIIGETNTTWIYPHLTVNGMFGYYPTSDVADNWNLTILDDLSGYTNLTDITDKSSYYAKNESINIYNTAQTEGIQVSSNTISTLYSKSKLNITKQCLVLR